ncbi:MAG: DNA/RNA non-specific endonuclease [Saprospiraceae bacterium]
MATFRTNHSRGGGGGTIVRVGIFATILTALILYFNRFAEDINTNITSNEENVDVKSFDFLPVGSKGQLLYNPYFTLAYNEKHEQAEWVAYELTAEQLNQPRVRRADEFRPDDRVKQGSASLEDYRGSGYDRGHLAPAADMAFNEEAMNYSFLLSNISPQAKNFNKGIWRELEELTRNWARDNEALYVITGPVLTETVKGTIGTNKVSVPAAYFKILLDMTAPQQKGIAFIIPNEVSFEPLHKFAVPIDEVEKRTGLDFFPNFDAEPLEQTFNLDFWEFSKKKYELRVNKWNKE